jgi:DNA polymerase V
MIEQIENFDINELLVDNHTATFLMRVSGYSMTGAGIYPKDIIVVDRSKEYKENSIVVACVNSEFTMKRLRKGHKSWELHPDNEAYPIVHLDPEDEVTVFGVVVGVTRKL